MLRIIPSTHQIECYRYLCYIIHTSWNCLEGYPFSFGQIGHSQGIYYSLCLLNIFLLKSRWLFWGISNIHSYLHPLSSILPHPIYNIQYPNINKQKSLIRYLSLWTMRNQSDNWSLNILFCTNADINNLPSLLDQEILKLGILNTVIIMLNHPILFLTFLENIPNWDNLLVHYY